ncbi:BrnT family toxin [Acidobacteria bacterium AB60]|nr:BrnT family toxin [Acidobacteria bacterium AB60]
MRYEWDERKNRENQRKHGGVSFELAMIAFEDDRRLIELDRVDETGEQRWHLLGAVSVEPGSWDVLTVVHVYREDEYGEELTRIISARWASKNEYRRYQNQAVE